MCVSLHFKDLDDALNRYVVSSTIGAICAVKIVEAAVELQV